MSHAIVERCEHVARALALLTASNATVQDCELERLDGLDAYRQVGVTRLRFVELALACKDEIGENLVGLSWLREGDLDRIDRILDAVQDPQARQLVCRLGAAVIAADGCIEAAERMVFEHMLGRWHLNAPMPAGDAAAAALH